MALDRCGWRQPFSAALTVFAHAVAVQVEAVGIVDEAVEDGVGVGRVADDGVPVLDGQLAGDDGRSPAVAFFEDFQKVVAGLGVERLEPPIVQDQELDIAQRAADASIPAIAARERQLAEQFGDALVEDGAVVAAGLWPSAQAKPTLSDAGRTADDQVVVHVDPVAGDELLEERAIEAARGAVVDVLDQRLLAQLGMAQPGGEFFVVPVGHLPVEQEGQPFRVGERRRLAEVSVSMNAFAMPNSPSWLSWSRWDG